MNENKGHQIFLALSKVIAEKLNVYKHERLDVVTCTKIYQDIFQTLTETLSSAHIKISNEGMNYLAQQFYDGILINGHQELDPNIFNQRAVLENIETREIAMLALLLNGTGFAIPLIHEIKHRS